MCARPSHGIIHLFFFIFSINLVCFQTWLIIFSGLLLLAPFFKSTYFFKHRKPTLFCVLFLIISIYEVCMASGPCIFHWFAFMVPGLLFVRVLTVNFYFLGLFCGKSLEAREAEISLLPFMAAFLLQRPCLMAPLSDGSGDCVFSLPAGGVVAFPLLLGPRSPHIPGSSLSLTLQIVLSLKTLQKSQLGLSSFSCWDHDWQSE